MMRDFDWRARDGFKPTRAFEEGEIVQHGNHSHTVVLQALEGGRYSVKSTGTKNNNGTQVAYEQTSPVFWYELFKIHDEPLPETHLARPVQFKMDKTNRTIEGLLSMVHSDHAGVDFSPSYQCQYVWSQDDKVKLIDSIFNNISIGLFVFAKMPFESDAKAYEIIDGKQRLTALVEFHEDRFQYKGYFYSELSARDKSHFENYDISMDVLNKPNEKEKYAAFLAINTFGKVMDEKHLEAVRHRYEELSAVNPSCEVDGENSDPGLSM